MGQSRERGERERTREALRERCADEEELGERGRRGCLLGPEWSRLELLRYSC